jgi:hypothetical protein
MKTQPAKPRFPATSGGSGYSTLHGRRLAITRVVWVAASLLAVTLFVAGLPLLYDEFQELRIYPPGERDAVQAQLIQLGLSVDLFAAYQLALTIIVAVAYFAVAAVIVWRKSDEPMALFVALLLVLLGAALWGSTSLLGNIHPLLEWLNRFLESLALGLLLLLFFLFPNGRFVPRWTRWPAGVLFTGMMVLSTLFPTSPFYIDNWPFLAYALFLLGWLLIGVYAQIYRYLRVSSPAQRWQTKWVLFGFTAVLAGYIGLISYSLQLGLPPTRPGAYVLSNIVTGTVASSLMLLIPLSIGVAILRYRVWDIDLVKTWSSTAP